MLFRKKIIYKLGPFHLSLFWTIFFSLLVPVAVVGILAAIYISNHELSLVQNQMEAHVHLAANSLESDFSDIEKESFHLCGNTIIKNSFLDSSSDAVLQNQLFSYIQLEKNSNSNISDILYFNPQNQMTISANYGGINQTVIGHYINRTNSDSLNTHLTQWQLNTDSPENCYSFIRLVPMLPEKNQGGFISFDMDLSILEKKLSDYNDDGLPSQLYIYTLQGTKIAGTIQDEAIEQEIQAQVLDTLDFSLESGSFFSCLPKSALLYTYIRTNTDRIYLHILPASYINKHLFGIIFLILTSLAFFSAIGVLFSLKKSRQLSQSVTLLAQQSRKVLEDKSEEPLPTSEIVSIQNGFQLLLSKLEGINEYVKLTEGSVNEQFAQKLMAGYPGLELSTPPGNTLFPQGAQLLYQVVIFHIEERDPEIWQNEHDEALILFAIKNVVTELIHDTPALSGISCNIHNKAQCRLLLSYNFGYPQKELQQNITGLSQEVCDFMIKMHITTVAGIGRPCQEPKDIPFSCAEAQKALLYRLIDCKKSVISIEDLEALHQKKDKFYPVEMEKQIIDSLNQNDLQAAKASFSDFVRILTSSNDPYFTRQSFLILLAGILRNSQGCEAELGECNVVKNLALFDSLAQTNRFFTETLFPLYIKANEAGQAEKGHSAVQKILQYISDHPTAELSLTQCAELVNMSPSYISRAFKKETGLTFLEYTIHVRVNIIKKMLVSTTYSINKIADSVGYSPRTLYRIFYQQVGMSPNEYRKKNS